MSYSVLVPTEIAERIRACPRVFLDEIFEQLERLGEDPDLAHRIPEGPLEGRMAYTFRVSRPPLSFRFTVLFQYHADEQHLVISDFGILRGDPPELSDPGFLPG